ncbi:MAG: ABC transporter ATP-binding protein [Phycisphaerae bacterium]|nr:ABC transporter ATP-binding protein [Phycisphaerae bacterium]
MPVSNGDNLIEVRDLQTHFHTEDGVARAVDGVSWSLPRGKTLALVGESGCGKSVTALSIMRLIPNPPGRIVGGKILFGGLDLAAASEKQMRTIRGNRIAMIFQEPMTSLNPVYTIGNQIAEAIELHQNLRGAEAWNLVIEVLWQVGIPAPEQRANEYPHQLSGGMRQRVMIAMALSCNPSLLIADEPTTALDVTIQAQILDLLRKLQAEKHMSILLITHDLGVVAEMADEVCVMYASKIVERASAEELFAHPLHPYTQGLFRSIPRIGDLKRRLDVIPGNVPNPLQFPPGCKFHPRCPLGSEDATCQSQDPPLKEIRPGHWAACWKCEGYPAYCGFAPV